MVKRICEKCGAEFDRFQYIDSGWRDFNTRKHCLCCVPFNSCGRAKVYNLVGKKKCKNCGKDIEKKQDAYNYCSYSCEHEYHYKLYIERWKNGLENGIRGKYQISFHIRRYLFAKYDNHCSKCGWGEVNIFTGKIPLEIHHKDGDYTNNKESNLDLLCPNCHSLTSTYKNGNKNNGRKARNKYN